MFKPANGVKSGGQMLAGLKVACTRERRGDESGNGDERKDAQGRVQLLCTTVVVSSAHSTRTASPNTRQHASRVSAYWCQAPSADPPTVHILPRRRSGDEADR